MSTKNNTNLYKTTRKTAKKKTASAGKKATNKLESLNQTTGKSYDSKEDQFERAKELEQILGIPEISPFKTYDPNIFEAMLEDANLTDLQAMAVRVGVFPSGNKTTLKNKLKRAFKSSLVGRGSVQLTGKPLQLDPNDPKQKEILDWLND